MEGPAEAADAAEDVEVAAVGTPAAITLIWPRAPPASGFALIDRMTPFLEASSW